MSKVSHKAQKMLEQAQAEKPKSECLQMNNKDLEAQSAALHAKMQQLDDLEREVKQAKLDLIEQVRPWHENACQRRKEYAPVVQVGQLRVNFQHRYCDIPPSQLREIQQAFADPAEADHYFTEKLAIKVRSEIMDDPDALDEMLEYLRLRMGPQRFARYFEVKAKLMPFPKYTEEKASLPAETRDKLEGIVRQVVAVSAAA